MYIFICHENPRGKSHDGFFIMFHFPRTTHDRTTHDRTTHDRTTHAIFSTSITPIITPIITPTIKSIMWDAFIFRHECTTPKNFIGITRYETEVKTRGIDISPFFDWCIDEEAVDALVSMGGDPSVTGGVFAGLDTWTIFKYRNITRRLYHGAKNLGRKDLEFAFRAYSSSAFGYSGTRILSRRRRYYLGVDKEKFDFWLKYKPSVYDLEPIQYHPFEGVLAYHTGAMLEVEVRYHRPMFALFSGSTQIKTIFTKKRLNLEEWVDSEMAFGEFHRKSLILVDCIRAASRDKRTTRRGDKRRRVEGLRSLRSFLHDLPLEVSRKIIRYL